MLGKTLAEAVPLVRFEAFRFKSAEPFPAMVPTVKLVTVPLET